MKRFKAFFAATSYIFLLLLPISSPTKAFANDEDFKITTDYNVDYREGEDFVTVTESVLFQVFNPDYYYPAGTTQTFTIQDYSIKEVLGERKFKKESIEVSNQYGVDLNYELVESSETIRLDIPTTRRIDSFNTYEITVKYKTHELVNFNGKTINIYVPGLHPDTIFTESDKDGLTTTYQYNTTVTTDNTLPMPSYTQPEDLTREEKGDNVAYIIPQEGRIGHTAWLQLGSSQSYYFKIIQKTPKTDNLTPEQLSKLSAILSNNVFKVALPREFSENNQKVFFKSISPDPQKIERDNEGNLIATFNVPANKESEIVIEGYITLYKPPLSEVDTLEEINLDEYRKQIKEDSDIAKYLDADKYWEIESDVVDGTAQTLLEGEDGILGLIRKNYDYLVDKFDYSFEKLSNGNPRLGAKAALNGSQAICMEYSDSLIALLRAQGIPARAAIGYGNDPTGAENRISNNEPLEQTIGHQWVQVWVPSYGWLSVDPTWGESDRVYIGSDLDHILWYTVGDNDEGIADTTVYSADSIDQSDLNGHKVLIQALNSEHEAEIAAAQPTDEIIQEYKGADLDGISATIKTTKIGRILVFLIPITVAIATTVTAISIIKFAFARIFRRKSIAS